MMMRAGLLFFGLLFLTACGPKITSRIATTEDIHLLAATPRSDKVSSCYDPLAYVAHPELLRMKYIRVNFHFMNSADGRYNMPETEVNQYVKDWVRIANEHLAMNVKMYLPHGNETPVLPIPYRYVVSPDPNIPGDDGIYYHIDDELCFAVKTGRERNISDKRVIDKYAIREDSVMNIFVQTHHLDSIKSKTYKPDASGISLGSSVKIFGRWHERPHPYGLKGITNHELGHSLGLSHTWSGHDGCDDTPPHPNCYNVSDKPPCDSLHSNNMMDYNLHMAALTPCQIGRILLNMTRVNSIQRNILVPLWCTLDTNATITIRDSVRWEGSADLEGNVVIESGGVLEISCRVSMPEGSTIKIYPGGKLVVLSTGRIHNSCNESWGGVELLTIKKTSGQLFIMDGGKIENAPQPMEPK